MPRIIHPFPSSTPLARDVRKFRKMSDQISAAQLEPVEFYGYLATRLDLHVNPTCRGDNILCIHVVLYILYRAHQGMSTPEIVIIRWVYRSGV